jgi:hypothetical protein
MALYCSIKPVYLSRYLHIYFRCGCACEFMDHRYLQELVLAVPTAGGRAPVKIILLPPELLYYAI